QLREDRQRQDLARGALAHRQASFLISQGSEALLAVERDRVVDRAADALRLEVRQQLVPPLGPPGVLTEDVPVGALHDRRRYPPQPRERLGVVGRLLAALSSPGAEVGEL